MKNTAHLVVIYVGDSMQRVHDDEGGESVTEVKPTPVVVSCVRTSHRAQIWRTLLVCTLMLAGPASALAQTKIEQLARRLTSSEDFRVRTQAALALGASNDKRAVAPLCRGLGDQNTTVRAAAAAALGKLKQGGSECLKRRLKEETSATVRASIEKALGDVTTEVEPEPELTAATQYYVAIDKPADNTGRDESGAKQLDGLIRTAMSKTAADLEGFVVAPKSETLAQAKKRLAKFSQVKGFLLSPRVEKPKYEGGNLTVRIEVAIFTYPGRALKGSIPVKLTQQGVSSTDEASENELIQMAAERAMTKFAQNAERID